MFKDSRIRASIQPTIAESTAHSAREKRGWPSRRAVPFELIGSRQWAERLPYSPQAISMAIFGTLEIISRLRKLGNDEELLEKT